MKISPNETSAAWPADKDRTGFRSSPTKDERAGKCTCIPGRFLVMRKVRWSCNGGLKYICSWKQF
jgi:hypothetical protein